MHLIYPPNFAQSLLYISAGNYSRPKRSWKQCLCTICGGRGANKVRYGRYASGEYKIRKKSCIHGEPKQILLFHSYGRKWKCGNVNIRAGLENPTSLSYAFSFFIWSEGFVSSLFAKMSFLHRQPVIFPSLYNKLTQTWWNREFSLFMKKNSENWLKRDWPVHHDSVMRQLCGGAEFIHTVCMFI